MLAPSAGVGTLTSMLVLAGQIFGALLVTTGVAKLRRPEDTARALAAVGFPAPRQLTWLLAVGELVVGALSVLLPIRGVFAVQALLYLGFLIWVVIALRTGAPIASCGCLGRDDTPPGAAHIIVDAIGMVASVGAMATVGGRPEFEGIGLVAAATTLIIGTAIAWMVLGETATALSGQRS